MLNCMVVGGSGVNKRKILKFAFRVVGFYVVTANAMTIISLLLGHVLIKIYLSKSKDLTYINPILQQRLLPAITAGFLLLLGVFFIALPKRWEQYPTHEVEEDREDSVRNIKSMEYLIVALLFIVHSIEVIITFSVMAHRLLPYVKVVGSAGSQVSIVSILGEAPKLMMAVIMLLAGLTLAAWFNKKAGEAE